MFLLIFVPFYPFLDFVVIRDVAFGTSRSLVIDGIKFINTGAKITEHVFNTANTEINITNSRFEGISMAKSLMYGENVTGHWENMYIKDCSPTGALFLEQDLVWTFINITIDNVPPAGDSTSILRFNTYFSDLPGCRVTFGGNITFINIPNVANGVGISLQHDYHTPIELYSLPSNPSNFIIRNSNFSLLSTGSTINSNGVNSTNSIEIGSIDADLSASKSSKPLSLQCYIFRLQEDVEYAARTGFTNITVLGNIISKHMGIISRGSFRTDNPFDIALNSRLQVLGSIDVTYDGDMESAFRLRWPMDIYAGSLTANLLPRSNGRVPVFISDLDENVYTALDGYLSFTVTNAFTIASRTAPYTWTPTTPSTASPVAAPSATPTAPASPPGSNPIPYTWLSPIWLPYSGIHLTIVAGSFSMTNFSLPRLTVYNSAYTGAAISVLSAELNITTTTGSVTFSGNQNVGGLGGAVHVGAFGSVTITAAENVVFADNIAYYGGAVSVDPSNSAELVFGNSTSEIHFIRNTAISAGGAALMPHNQVSTMLTPSSLLFSENRAVDFGCVFAFGLTVAESDVDDATCSGTFDASFNDNARLSPSYSVATHCSKYEAMCQPFVPPAPVPAPVLPPIPVAAPAPIAPTPTPVAAPPTTANIPAPVVAAPPPVGCRATANIPAGAVCVNGTYQTTASSFLAFIANSTSTGPANSTSPPKLGAPVSISGGNVSIPSIDLVNVLANSRSSGSQRAMITSTDCINILNVSVTLTDDDVEIIETSKSITAKLIESSCPPPEAVTIKVDGAKPKKSCKKTQSTTQVTTTSLQATFTITSSNCNTWWIILVSVIGGIVLLVVIFIIVILLLPERARAKIQPFYKASDGANSNPNGNRAYSNID